MALKYYTNSDSVNRTLISCTLAAPLSCHTWIFASVTVVLENSVSKEFEV